MSKEEQVAAAALSPVGGVAVVAYGVLSYLVGVTALVGVIVYMLGLLPFTGGPVALSGWQAVAFNVALMVIFGLQHSVMARLGFKSRLTRLLPASVERATYVMMTGVVLLPLLWLWQPLDTTIWRLDDPMISAGLIGVSLLGWGYLLASSFAIDHFELFGLKQVYNHARGYSPPTVPFVERWMYRFDRHPIMTGVLVGMWVTPHMTLDHLLFATLSTAYILIGVHFEQRTLVRLWGDRYLDYMDRTWSLVPTIRPSRPPG